MSILVTFADGNSTLVASREAAEQIAAYWPELKATIRDLDQEARDREEMIGLLVNADYCCSNFCGADGDCYDQPRAMCPEHVRRALLKRLGRLPVPTCTCKGAYGCNANFGGKCAGTP